MKHILFDLEGCDKDLLDDARHVRNSYFMRLYYQTPKFSR